MPGLVVFFPTVLFLALLWTTRPKGYAGLGPVSWFADGCILRGGQPRPDSSVLINEDL